MSAEAGNEARENGTEGERVTLGFETEAKQLLRLMVHSLYSSREIFLRELISNASDAADRLRFEALKDPELYEDDPEPCVRIEADGEARTLAVEDNGIGMSREELIENLGTIAHSGTMRFLDQLTGDARADAQLIGQFGVGFYSSFIVADHVEVTTRRAGASDAWRWSSAGESDYSVEPAERSARGTRVVLHLKEDADEFLEPMRLHGIIKKYADHIAIPVQLRKRPEESEESEDGEADAQASEAPQWETVNQAKALWTRPKKEISEEEYREFYHHVAHDFEDPLAWSHNKVEGKLEYTSLLYVPRRAPFDLYNRESPRGVKLYVQRVFIMDDAEQFLPLYLRFVRGVVDSADLPLNVSREILQQDKRVESIRGALTKRVLDMLESLAEERPEDYQRFWDELGQVLKEGVAEDFANRERIAGLLRFATTKSEGATQNQSLPDYLARMPEGQKHIYYVTGETYAAAAASPHLERFRERGVEVLLLHDRLDEWLMTALGEYDGKQLKDVARGELDAEELGLDEAAQKTEDDAHAGLIGKLRSVLEDELSDVRTTRRLTESPACVVVGEHDVGSQMRRLLEAAGQPLPESKPVLEVNPEHALVQRLEAEEDGERFADLARVLLDQARLADGAQLDDPAGYVRRINRLLLELSGAA